MFLWLFYLSVTPHNRTTTIICAVVLMGEGRRSYYSEDANEFNEDTFNLTEYLS